MSIYDIWCCMWFFKKNALYPFPPISWKLPPAIPCLVRKRSDSPAGTERPNLQVEWQAVSGIRFFSGLNSLNCATMAATKVVNFRQCHSFNRPNSWAIPATSCLIESPSKLRIFFKSFWFDRANQLADKWIGDQATIEDWGALQFFM